MNFWHRYEKLNLKIAFFLISLQILHLYWLTTDVVLNRIYGHSFSLLPTTGLFFILFVIIDYIEVPGLVAGITFYSLSIYQRGRKSAKDSLLLAMLVVQVFHIFWITDEIVFETIVGTKTGLSLPAFASWVAILIDYLELPVMGDLFYRVFVKKDRK